MEGTGVPKKVLKAEFGEVGSVGKPRKIQEYVVQQDAARFCVFATGSWLLMIEHSGGRR
jgi:hypothetical protein